MTEPGPLPREPIVSWRTHPFSTLADLVRAEYKEDREMAVIMVVASVLAVVGIAVSIVAITVCVISAGST